MLSETKIIPSPNVLNGNGKVTLIYNLLENPNLYIVLGKIMKHSIEVERDFQKFFSRYQFE